MKYFITFSLLTLNSMSFTAMAQSVEQQKCGHNSLSIKLSQLIIEHTDQQREFLQCNDELAKIAQQRAEQLAKNEHDPEVSPNQMVIKGGFRFPSYYPISGNQVEAVAKKIATASGALSYLVNSEKHQDHILGKGEFFSLQSQIAVGYYSDDDITNHDQWVVLIAQPYQTPKIVYKQEFNMPFKIAKGCEKDWQNSNDEFLKRKCGSMSGKARKKKQEAKLNCDETNCKNE